jgi:hypothetical protein
VFSAGLEFRTSTTNVLYAFEVISRKKRLWHLECNCLGREARATGIHELQPSRSNQIVRAAAAAQIRRRQVLDEDVHLPPGIPSFSQREWAGNEQLIRKSFEEQIEL